jgi:hypothetical protein
MNFGIFLQWENSWTGSMVRWTGWCSRVHGVLGGSIDIRATAQLGPMWQRHERGGVAVGVHKPEEKVPFGEYSKASRAGWPSGEAAAGREEWANVSRLGPVQPDPKKNSNGN